MFNIKEEIEVFISSASNNKEEIEKVLILSKNIRELNISVYTDYRNIKIQKKLQYANKLGTFFFIVIGQEELESNIVIIKDLDNRTGQEVFFNSIPQYIKHSLNSIY